MCKRTITARHYSCHTCTDEELFECRDIRHDRQCKDLLTEHKDFYATGQLCLDCYREQEQEELAKSLAGMDIKGKSKEMEEEDDDSDARTITPITYESEELDDWMASTMDEQSKSGGYRKLEGEVRDLMEKNGELEDDEVTVDEDVPMVRDEEGEISETKNKGKRKR